MTTTVAPLQRWTRDDWVIPCTLQDQGGQPVNLTGMTIGGELWLPGYRVFSPLTVANGGVIRVADLTGQFTVVVPRLSTAQAARQDLGGQTRVLIYAINTLGRRQTLGVVPFEVFDAGSDDLAIDEVPTVTLVSQSTTLRMIVAASQGAPGPSNISAAQISDGSDAGRAVLQAADAAAIRALLSVPSFGRKAVDDTPYVALPSDSYVGFVGLTAPRTVTLPQANAYPPGQPLWIADETGLCSTGTPIIVAAIGNDTIVGQANISLASPYQKLALHSNGTNLWTI